MIPANFKEKNITYGKPEGWTEEECGSAEILLSTIPVGDDGRVSECVVSRWRPSDEERKRIANGGDIYLTMLVGTMIPVMLTTELPEGVNTKGMDGILQEDLEQLGWTAGVPEFDEWGEDIAYLLASKGYNILSLREWFIKAYPKS